MYILQLSTITMYRSLYFSIKALKIQANLRAGAMEQKVAFLFFERKIRQYKRYSQILIA